MIKEQAKGDLLIEINSRLATNNWFVQIPQLPYGHINIRKSTLVNQQVGSSKPMMAKRAAEHVGGGRE